MFDEEPANVFAHPDGVFFYSIFPFSEQTCLKSCFDSNRLISFKIEDRQIIQGINGLDGLPFIGCCFGFKDEKDWCCSCIRQVPSFIFDFSGVTESRWGGLRSDGWI